MKSRGLWAKEMELNVTLWGPRMRYYGYNNAKEVSYAQLTGTPGLTFRSGRTMLSYQWSLIAPASPTATKTRTKSKSWCIVLLSHRSNLACYLCGVTLRFYLYLVKRTVCLMLSITCCVAGVAPDVREFVAAGFLWRISTGWASSQWRHSSLQYSAL